jgi:hypothetical protein
MGGIIQELSQMHITRTIFILANSNEGISDSYSAKG